MQSTHESGTFAETFHFDCVIRTFSGYNQPSRVKQIKLYCTKT